jgi:phage shock protein C
MQPRRLYRSTSNRILAGVCGGLAEYLNIDPIIVRILAIILPVNWVAYLFCAIVIPPGHNSY